MIIFSKYRSNGFFWFRIFGWGIVGKDLSKHYLMFSERKGITKRVELFGWSFRLLKPNKI